MAPGGDASARHRLRSWLRSRHLTKGSPTSPAQANLACFTLDRRLDGYAAAAGLVYTRCADDLAFSGEAVEAARLVRAVTQIVRDEGFAVRATKTRVRHPGSST
jgi:hypothetical protein